MSRPTVLALLGGLVVVGVVAALLVFEPWRAWTSSTVDEALPVVAEPVRQPAATSAAGATTPPAPPVTPAPPAGPVELAAGAFEDGEHATTGTARIIELADGTRFLRLEDFATSDGPDVVVWLTDQPSGGEWGSYDDGRFAELGELTATNGNQNYPIPVDVDLAGLTSVVVWCDRFDVAFGTAPVSLG